MGYKAQAPEMLIVPSRGFWGVRPNEKSDKIKNPEIIPLAIFFIIGFLFLKSCLELDQESLVGRVPGFVLIKLIIDLELDLFGQKPVQPHGPLVVSLS
jgi:hypothetical protein